MQDLSEQIRQAPQEAGVYQYFDENSRLLYVGKAKSLKKRVKSYFSFTPRLAPNPKNSLRIQQMISQTRAVKFIVTESENDALVLENSLIKQLKPKYNILLRDDKTYPYIYYDAKDPFARLAITRKVIRRAGIKYFGPFVSGAQEILNAIYDNFALVQKSSCIRGKKACLYAQLGKCHAPCEGKISAGDYKRILDAAIEHVERTDLLLERLEAKMQAYAAALAYEEAQKVKESIEAIKRSKSASSLDLASLEDFDVFCVESYGESACGVRFFVRRGRLAGADFKKFKFAFGFDKDEAYKRFFLSSFSSALPFIPAKIYIKDDFLERESIEEWLKKAHGKSVSLLVPKRGDKKRITDLAQKNAQEILRLEKPSGTDEIKRYFALEAAPERIECFDNSHLLGQSRVGAMVVFEGGKEARQDYRLYILQGRDEYSQMKELLTRRANAFLKNPPPDLWLIDGGQTLCALAESILQSVGVSLPVFAIAKEKLDFKAHRAKGAARDILHYGGREFRLSPTDERLQFFQRIRDEAHRAAITFHRKRKLKADMELEFLKAHGIGAAKLKRLVDFFGSFEEIRRASLEDLSLALNQKDAQQLVKILRSGQQKD